MKQSRTMRRAILWTTFLLAILIFAPFSAAPASAAAAEVSIDTATVYGTARTTATPTSRTIVAPPPARTSSEPGQPDAVMPEPSTQTSSPSARLEDTRVVQNPGNGRNDRKSFPWWLLLILGAGVAVAVNGA